MCKVSRFYQKVHNYLLCMCSSMRASGVGVSWDPPNIHTNQLQSLIIDVRELIFHDPISEGHVILCDILLVIKDHVNSFPRLQHSRLFSPS